MISCSGQLQETAAEALHQPDRRSALPSVTPFYSPGTVTHLITRITPILRNIAQVSIISAHAQASDVHEQQKAESIMISSVLICFCV